MKEFRIIFLYSNYFLNYAKILLEVQVWQSYVIENFQEIDLVF